MVGSLAHTIPTSDAERVKSLTDHADHQRGLGEEEKDLTAKLKGTAIGTLSRGFTPQPPPPTVATDEHDELEPEATEFEDGFYSDGAGAHGRWKPASGRRCRSRKPRKSRLRTDGGTTSRITAVP
jgi:hypothetical protein